MTPPPRLERAVFHVANLGMSIDFYRALGLSSVGHATGEHPCAVLQYPDDPLGAAIELRQSGACARPTGRSSYWKVGITVDDLDRACHDLLAKGIETSAPHRFERVGYLCHTSDPDGFAIEILQRTFEQDTSDSDPGCRRSGDARRLAHITYRVHDLDRSLDVLCGTLGMSINGQLEVDSHGFSLTFLSWDRATAPKELGALSATEWLWQRPHTLVELWHSQGQQLEHDPGFGGIVVSPKSSPSLEGPATLEGYAISLLE